MSARSAFPTRQLAVTASRVGAVFGIAEGADRERGKTNEPRLSCLSTTCPTVIELASPYAVYNLHRVTEHLTRRRRTLARACPAGEVKHYPMVPRLHLDGITIRLCIRKALSVGVARDLPHCHLSWSRAARASESIFARCAGISMPINMMKHCWNDGGQRVL